MPFLLKILLALLFLLLQACHDKKTLTPDPGKPYHLLIESANNEKQSLPNRLAAASQALDLAEQQKNIPAQIESMRLCGRLYIFMDSTDKALALFRRLAPLAESEDDKQSLGIVYNNIGLILGEQSVYDSAIIYYEKADKLFRAIGDSLRIVQGQINTGIVYKDLGAFEKAFSMTLDAARIMERMNASSALATAYNTLGNTLKEIRRPAEALVYHQKAITIRQQLKDSTGIAGSLNNIGNVYKSTGQYALALAYYQQSLKLKQALGLSRSKVTTIDNIAETYLGLEQYDLAEQYEREAFSMRNEKEDKDGWMTSANRLAKIYLARNEIEKAKEMALQISKVADAPIYLGHQLDNALLLGDIYSRLKDHAAANQYAKKALQLKDSLFNSDMSAAISKMNVRFRTEEQQKKLELAEKNDIIQEQRINKQKYFIVLLGSIAFLLLIISYLLYLSAKLRKQSRERTELLMSELNHRTRNNFQMVSDILNLQILTTSVPKELELIKAGKRRIQSISIVHNLLYKKEYTGYIDIKTFISEIARNLEQAFQTNEQKMETRLDIDNILIVSDQAIPLGLIINELLTNIYKYGRAAGDLLTVELRMISEKNDCTLYLSDNALPWDMMAARKQKNGLGLLLVDMLVRQLKGRWQSYRQEEKNIQFISFTKTQ